MPPRPPKLCIAPLTTHNSACVARKLFRSAGPLLRRRATRHSSSHDALPRRPFHRWAIFGGITSDPLRAGGGITARWDAVRCPIMLVSFSILIPNTLSLFFSFCARRLLHRGASLGGIASDPLWAGGRITVRGDAVRSPFMLVSFLFLFLIPFRCSSAPAGYSTGGGGTGLGRPNEGKYSLFNPVIFAFLN